MDWFKNISMGAVIGAVFGACFGMYRLGRKTGREKAIEACSELAQGRDYTWKSDVLIREEFDRGC